MPRAGRMRKKQHTEKDIDESETTLKRTPRSFVLKRGKVGDRIRDLVKDVRMVMSPNTAKKVRETKTNRMQDFVAMSSTFGVSQIFMFSATKQGTFMKLVKLPAGPTLTFKVDEFSLMRDVKSSQKKPRSGERDFTAAAMQVMSGFGSGAVGSGTERTLMAEMFRGLFPPVDVASFNHHEVRRTALFNYDAEKDVTTFRHYSVARKAAGLQRGVSKLLRRHKIAKLGNASDVADFVLSGGVGASESEGDEPMEAPIAGGGKVGVRLSEIGPRMDLKLIKAEEGMCNGAVLYHRYQTKLPSQIEVLEQKARERKKLRARNVKMEEFVGQKKKMKNKAKKDRQDARRKEDAGDDDGEGDGYGGDAKGGDSDTEAKGNASKKQRGGGNNQGTDDASGGKGGGKGNGKRDSKGEGKSGSKGKSGKGKSGGKGKGSSKGKSATDKVMNRFSKTKQ